MLFTIGVYGFDLEHFLAALRHAGVERVVDVRQRRGVRGPQYAWANAQRLTEALEQAGIDYVHLKALAPTTALRQAQYAADDREGVGKRNRVALDRAYVEGYTEQILDRADLDAIPLDRPAALLCVETDAGACHRSLITERLGLPVTHLRP